MTSAPVLNAPHPLAGIDTPCLVLDEDRMLHNIARLKTRLARLGVPLRPHLKTAKSIPAARAVMDGPGGPAAVSTLQEAEAFAAAGVKDILYAVGIAPQKLDRVAALRRQGVDLSVVLDSVEQAAAVIAMARMTGDCIPVLIEIDCDGHRAGVSANDPLLVEIGRALHQGGAELRGVMAHAGESYSCRSVEALEQAPSRSASPRLPAPRLCAGPDCPAPWSASARRRQRISRAGSTASPRYAPASS